MLLRKVYSIKFRNCVFLFHLIFSDRNNHWELKSRQAKPVVGSTDMIYVFP